MSSSNTPGAGDALAAAMRAAEQLDGTLKAFVHRPVSYAMPGPAAGPLAGIPVAVKDLIDTADMPTTYGSKVFAGHRPQHDAWIVAKLRSLGAVIFGKTVTTEFAWRDAGPTVNPWNPAHSPGGSSSGSAAAVGAGIVDIALGTQTVGSVIRPASYCGAIGYKPTFGLIPTDGVHDLAPSLDHLGFITSSVYWAAVCHALVARDGSVAAPASPARFEALKPRRIGLYRSSQWSQVAADVQHNFEAVVKRLQAHGVQCETVELSDDIVALNALTTEILSFEGCAAIQGEIAGREELAGPYTRELVARGQAMDEVEYGAAIERLDTLREHANDCFGQFDAIISITSPTTALPGLEKTGDASFCAPATLLGLPAVSVPSGFSGELLPYGVQLIGRSDDDLALLGMAQWLSEVLPGLRRPALPVPQ
ncbi:amidase [Herbaspirillum sp. YR522]|uniref:amidase n=1 Tax=Herbaspirillum sp. YR522 TaxID=1144342 RepID=UPI00026FCDBB|nr:amidase [Herbaspirillum sp. YR522]EJM97562.1 amidase, Asp-tRNAAsn/Glu-tRNAGln amidotransferase A subunit [Herbaspirillum sp. YR522]